MDKMVILDLETTGLNYSTDTIIEIGLIEFCVVGGTPYITNMYSGLEDPGFPLEPVISEVTHIHDEFLKDQKIDCPRQPRRQRASGRL